jgi:translation initiation factor 5B
MLSGPFFSLSQVGTMLCVPALTLDVGRVTSIENNHREVPSAKKGTSVSIKISNESNPQMTYGRQFDHTHTLYRSVAGETLAASVVEESFLLRLTVFPLRVLVVCALQFLCVSAAN